MGNQRGCGCWQVLRRNKPQSTGEVSPILSDKQSRCVLHTTYYIARCLYGPAYLDRCKSSEATIANHLTTQTL